MELQQYRMERMALACQRHGVDALVASCGANISYITGGYHSVGQDVLNSAQVYAMYQPEKNRVAYIVSVAEVPSVLEHCENAQIYCFGGFNFAYSTDTLSNRVAGLREARFNSAEEALAAAIQSVNGRVALDESRTNFAIYQKLYALTGRDIVPGVNVFNDARMVKHPDEIAAIGRSAVCADECLQEALKGFEPGMSEYDIQRLYMLSAAKRGAAPFFFVATAAKRAAYADTINTPLKISKGDMIRFDFGVILGGYPSDLARTAVVGEPSKKLSAAYEAIRLGTKRAIEACKPGVAASQIFEAAMKATRENGLPEYQRHHCGHGIGLEAYDLPSIAPSCSIELQENMTLCIETPYYELGWGGAQIENTIVINKTGASYLDKSGDGLIVL